MQPNLGPGEEKTKKFDEILVKKFAPNSQKSMIFNEIHEKFSPSASAGFCGGIKKKPHTRKAVLIVNSHLENDVFSLLNRFFRRFPRIPV